jgi:hypothetical protein
LQITFSIKPNVPSLILLPKAEGVSIFATEAKALDFRGALFTGVGKELRALLLDKYEHPQKEEYIANLVQHIK